MKVVVLGGKGMLGRNLATACGTAGIEAEAHGLARFRIAIAGWILAGSGHGQDG